MRKLIFLLILILCGLQVNASVDTAIRKSRINKSAISISVKDVHTGKCVYKLNEKQPVIPASTLKLITLAASEDALGKNYKFTTRLYKSSQNELYLKLSGDPFLTSADLKQLAESAIKKKIYEPKAIYLDDFIFDKVEWGEGWQWDDDLNPLMPKFGVYNLDKNLLDIIISPTVPNAPAYIRTAKFYPVTFMNLVKTSAPDDVRFSRNNSISPDVITAEGTVQKQFTAQIPVNYPKRYFILRLEEVLRSVKMGYYGKFLSKKLPSSNVYLVGEISHSLDNIASDILKNSSNLSAESVFKAAGAKYTNSMGTLENSQKMLTAYFEKIGISYDDIKIVDGSGVSKNNIITVDFMTNFLLKQDKNYINLLPTAGEGTLNNRMLYFKNNLKAKTGTLSDVSSIAGYITSRRGKLYVFDIVINDPKSAPGEKKSLEEYILREIYANF